MDDILLSAQKLVKKIQTEIESGASVDSYIEDWLELLDFEYPNELIRFAILGLMYHRVAKDDLDICKGSYVGKRSTHVTVYGSNFLGIHHCSVEGCDWYVDNDKKNIEIGEQYPKNIKNDQELFALFTPDDARNSLETPEIQRNIVHYIILKNFIKCIDERIDQFYTKGDYSHWDY